MKKWRLFLLCVLGASIIASMLYLKCTKEQPRQVTKTLKEYPSYFFSVPIVNFSSTNTPCLMVQIEEKNLKVELDLGFQGEVVLSKGVIKNIREKAFIGERTMHGAKGKSYKKNMYEAPKIHIGNLGISNCIMHEEVEEFILDSYYIKNTTIPATESSGRIGWEIFKKCNLFLDLPNSRIAFCDSAQTLEKEGYRIKDFVKIPLHTERGFIEMRLERPEGSPQMWILDTGTTWNIVNANDHAKSIEEMICDPKNEIELFFKVENVDFGPLLFHKMPIPLPIHIDAVLGMEFLKTRQVFIDFNERQIYIEVLSKT